MRRASITRSLPLLGLLAGCGGATPAQPPPRADLPTYAPHGGAATGAGHKEAPPASSEAKPSPFPAVRTQTLKNGLIVAIVEAHALPIVQVRVVVRAGSGYAPKQPGLAEITGEMLKDGGARGQSGAEVLKKIEAMGADLSVDVGLDATTVATGVTKGHFEAALGLVGDVVQAPRFDEAELAKLKGRASDEAEDQLRSSGQFTAMHALFREIEPKESPYATYGALPQDIAKITAPAIRDFHRRFFVPKNTTVVLVGDVDASAIETVERAFGNMTGDAPPKVDFPPPAPLAKRRVIVAHRPKSAQSDVFVVTFAPPRDPADARTWADVKVGNQILGGGVAGRLFADVREQRSLAYSTYSRVVDLAHGPQPVLAYAGTQTEKTADAVLGVIENEEKLAASGVTEDEAAQARRYLSDVFAIRMETASSIANLVGDLAGLGLPYDTYDTYRAAVRASTSATVSAAATKLVQPSAALIVVAGDADVIAPKLTRFGDVTVVDPEQKFATVKTLAAETK